MGPGVTYLGVRVGPVVRLVRQDAHGIELEGPLKLQPGRRVRVLQDEGLGEREATVWTWWLVRAGSDGSWYRGVCRWI